MAKATQTRATYEDMQQLKYAIARLVSEFKAEFGDAAVAVGLKFKVLTTHGIETISIKLEETPAIEQGRLPMMNDWPAQSTPPAQDIIERLRKEWHEEHKDDE